MQRGRESVGEMAMVVCESVRVCECVSLVGACAKLRKETNWAGLAFCWLAGCWRGVAWRWNARLETRPTEFSLAAGRDEGRRLRPKACDRMR
jgi:hypothetical protein